MTTFAGIAVSDQSKGTAYCTAAAITTTEGDLGTPVVVPNYVRNVLATAAIALGSTTSPTYIVLQMDLGDGNWIDAAWITTTDTSGTDIFALAAGSELAGAVQQTRASGTGPSSIGSNPLPLGSRFRFIAKTGANNKATVTITYRYEPVR
jgi:hypothetical protein